MTDERTPRPVSNPRDPRHRRHSGRPGDTLAAAVRLDLAVDAMRAQQLGRGPEPVWSVDESTELAPALAAAVQGGTHEPRLTAEEFAAALAAPDPEQFDREHLTGPQVYDEMEESPVPPPASPPPAPPASPPPAPTAAPEPPAPVPADTAERAVRDRAATVADHRPAGPVPAFSSERSLTWRSRHDPRSLAFGVRATLTGSAPVQDKLWPVGPVLDQGAEGQCVGCAVVDAGNVPLVARLEPPFDLEDATRIYKRAQQLDEVPGEAYSGTSVLAGMKAGVEAGLFGGYLWAFGTRDVAQAVLQRGPVVIGVPWLSGMYETGPGGVVKLDGEDQGVGHCLAVVGMRRTGPAGEPGPFFVWQNSWGPSYGDGGLGYIHHRDLARLLHGHGEAAIPTAQAQAPR
jgi:Papain family cysteine protease